MKRFAATCSYANSSLFIYNLVALFLTGCAWHGIRPVKDKISLADQSRLATVIVLAEPVETRKLHHSETIPTAQFRGPSNEYIQCDAVEKVLKVRQVLRGSVSVGSLLKIETYQTREGLPNRISSDLAIFFLTRDRDTWAPLTDFGRNTIRLEGFPNRTLAMKRVEEGPTSWIELDRVLVDALLDPRNASDWPMFHNALGSLIKTAYDLIGTDPAFIIDHLVVLSNSKNLGVEAEARKQIRSLTGVCGQTGPQASESAGEQFMQTEFCSMPAASSQERELTYWRLKGFSCSKLPQVRAKAEAMLHLHFPDRKTVGCEICTEPDSSSALP